MAQFRLSRKVGPVRLTVGKRGISTSVGAGPFRISRGSDGKVRRTVRIPGTGIYDTKVVGSTDRKTQGHETVEPPARVVGPSWQTAWIVFGACMVGVVFCIVMIALG